MNTKNIRGLIIATAVLQFLWFVILLPGNRLSPRSPEMAQALRAYETNRSATTEKAMWEQVHQDELRDSRRKEVLFSLMLASDGIAIFFFLELWSQKNTA
jgi:hypothetical protein